MKVKEVDRTANIAWSPAAQHPIYLAAGTAAQQLDATFSTTAALEIYGLNLTEPGFDLELKGSVTSDYRFHNLSWGCHGMTSGNTSSGVIVGGADGGNMLIYDPTKILAGEDGLVAKKTKHSGPVRSLDFNSHQPNLLASGGGDSEIFIWDLVNPTNPMTPGTKSQPLEDVTCVAWNCQVQHILASTFTGRCIVWDLRKNEPIIKVSDSTSHMKCKVIAWHPAVATQMCIASEDDQAPVIQLWDLRFATSPLKVMQNHQRGVLSLAWCSQDPDLLASCGKDSHILCWNPNSNVPDGEVVCELNTGDHWSFNVAWCDRNPAVIASSSFDGHVGVYSLMGGQQQVKTSSKITDAFPGSESFAQPPSNQTPQKTITLPLKKPPKWLRKPVGASFAFGGKLVSFEHHAEGAQKVTISQVKTEIDIMDRSMKLEQTLSAGAFSDFCQHKSSSVSSDFDKTAWSFLTAKFDSNPKLKALSLLGYDSAELSKKIQSLLTTVNGVSLGVDAEELADRMNSLSAGAPNSQLSTPNFVGSQTPENSRDISRDAFDLIADSKSSVESPVAVGFPIPVENGMNGMIAKAILVGNIQDAVSLCLQEERMADALVLAMAVGGDLLQKTKEIYLKQSNHEISKLISAVVNNNWKQLVLNCDIMYWKEALSAILTYSKDNEFSELCEILGKRLESERNGEYFNKAVVCYICSGNLDSFVACYSKINKGKSPAVLQDLMEQVLILEKSVEVGSMQSVNGPTKGPLLASKLNAYAKLLATQGELAAAFKYLATSDDTEAGVLKDRIYKSISSSLPGTQPPPFPFRRVSVQPAAQPMQSQSIPKHKVPQNQSWSINQPPSTGSFYQPNQFQAPSSDRFNQTPGFNPPFRPQTPPSQIGSSVNNFQAQPMQTPPMTNQAYVSSAPTAPPPTSTVSQSHKGLLSQRYPTMPADASLQSQNSYTSNQVPYSSFPQQQNFGHQPNFAPNMMVNPSPADNMVGSPLNQQIYNPNSISNEPISAPPPSNEPPFYPAAMTELKQGWNDPPMLKSKPQAKSPENVQSTITQAIFNPNQAPTNEMQPPAGYNQNFGAPPAPMVPDFNYANQTNAYNSPPVGNQMNQNNQIEKSNPPLQPPMPVEEKKGPVPSEHQVIQDVFDNLKLQCSNIATNPQMRRKLDDVSRKLENLYDKLRGSSLSETTVSAVHQMVQSVQQKNYQGAIAIHTSLITSGNFSEMSNFMPGLKVLFQIAMQLGV